MKAILVRGMDMPKRCFECACAYFTEGAYHNYCQAVGYQTDIEKYGDEYHPKGRPEWCPLAEVHQLDGGKNGRE